MPHLSTLLVAVHDPGRLPVHPGMCRSVCAVATTPRHLPEGKLVPLPIPERPWSHIGIDFMTDLPPSNAMNCVFIVADRFSKACKLIPLKGLSTAFEAAEALFTHVSSHFGLPT